MILKAIKFASKKHAGQRDDCGKSYFYEHCFKVAYIIDYVCHDDDNLLCAAYLHDTIEDTNTDYDELVREFNKDVADLVMEVTHEGRKDEIGYYFPRLKTQRGIVLKFADRISNLSRMESWDDNRKNHYLRKSKFWKSEGTK